MKIKESTFDVGVIVGRFQVPELHDAHKRLIQAVCERHDKVLIFLGLSPLMVTKENPLDFEARKQMLLAEFPNVNVLYIKDLPSDPPWVKRLDEMIDDVVTPAQSVILYGGRDSFIKHYEPHGQYATAELESDVIVSGSEVRKQVRRASVKASPDFRAGAVWAAGSRFPTSYTCVDVAVFDDNVNKLLLGRKTHETQYRLPGGFADPRSHTFEQDARREVQEETGLRITDPKYVASFSVDDWRYRNEEDGIKTLLFTADRLSGAPRAADDLAEVRWFDLRELDIEKDVIDNHRALVHQAIMSVGRYPSIPYYPSANR